MVHTGNSRCVGRSRPGGAGQRAEVFCILPPSAAILLDGVATLHPRMFIAHSTLETWLDSGHVDVDDQIVVLKNHQRSYHLQAAVRFLSVVPQGRGAELIGKVLTESRIQELGGEIMGDSVLFGESAFEVEAGYVGTLQDV